LSLFLTCCFVSCCLLDARSLGEDAAGPSPVRSVPPSVQSDPPPIVASGRVELEHRVFPRVRHFPATLLAVGSDCPLQCSLSVYNEVESLYESNLI
jgi:hypothetical protein